MKNLLKEYLNLLKLSFEQLKELLVLTSLIFLAITACLYIMFIFASPGLLALYFISNKIAAFIVFLLYMLLIWVPLVVSFFERLRK